jgi:hypothetical protein
LSNPSRWRRLVLWCLIVGVVGTLAISIVSALQLQTADGSSRQHTKWWIRQEDFALAKWWSSAPSDFPKDPQVHFVRGSKFGTVQVVAASRADHTWCVLQTVSVGWPRPAFTGSRWVRGVRPLQTSDEWTLFRVRVVPFLPKLDGFAFNALAIASVPFILIGITFVIDDLARALKVWMTRKVGCCPECQYDLRGNPSAGCPECGWRRAI